MRSCKARGGRDRAGRRPVCLRDGRPGTDERTAHILGDIRHTLSQSGPLAGQKVVVTAGGTQEPLDPVRYLTNRSSGKQGYALAQAALDMGASVTLVSAPTGCRTPHWRRDHPGGTAAEMLAAVLAQTEDADILLMAAAVADFKPPPSRTRRSKKTTKPPPWR